MTRICCLRATFKMEIPEEEPSGSVRVSLQNNRRRDVTGVIRLLTSLFTINFLLTWRKWTRYTFEFVVFSNNFAPSMRLTSRVIRHVINPNVDFGRTSNRRMLLLTDFFFRMLLVTDFFLLWRITTLGWRTQFIWVVYSKIRCTQNAR